MTDWVRQGKGGRGSPGTWARRLARLRHFIRYLKQFEPDTEVPDESIFGPEPGRVAPHIYREEEIVELLAAARKLGPRGSLRGRSLRSGINEEAFFRPTLPEYARSRNVTCLASSAAYLPPFP